MEESFHSSDYHSVKLRLADEAWSSLWHVQHTVTWFLTTQIFNLWQTARQDAVVPKCWLWSPKLFDSKVALGRLDGIVSQQNLIGLKEQHHLTNIRCEHQYHHLLTNVLLSDLILFRLKAMIGTLQSGLTCSNSPSTKPITTRFNYDNRTQLWRLCYPYSLWGLKGSR